MAQTREECLIFLNKARDALDELSLLDDQEKQLNQEEKQLSQSLSAEKKLIADTIQQTIKKRREEINTTYDKEIDKAQTLLKKAKARREKAKNQGIKERIGSETAALKEQNQELGTQLKTLFKCHHVPRFCRSPLYYSLYFPYRIKEYFFLFLGILALFLALWHLPTAPQTRNPLPGFDIPGRYPFIWRRLRTDREPYKNAAQRSPAKGPGNPKTNPVQQTENKSDYF